MKKQCKKSKTNTLFWAWKIKTNKNRQNKKQISHNYKICSTFWKKNMIIFVKASRTTSAKLTWDKKQPGLFKMILKVLYLDVSLVAQFAQLNAHSLKDIKGIILWRLTAMFYKLLEEWRWNKQNILLTICAWANIRDKKQAFQEMMLVIQQ